ncbi:S-adenosylmethionine sensor upstream of mTORC1 [Agrilus planipennis]|uniref:S-adenosylmethionine sensor upstream of mTORC1 n=1 Tax=Agrilus planipennis TaxID=224129 RepID=A0A1W4XHA1_AGRPL|nr:S-adenosylmethionine sensor upstream of mTORC1 [Agrilus planipennis]
MICLIYSDYNQTEMKRKTKPASNDHLKLSQIIKDVHKNLREDAKRLGTQKAWINHCKQEESLLRYAQAMKELATRHWEKNYNNNCKAKSRIKWIYEYCRLYFFDGELLRQRRREIEIARKIVANESCERYLLGSFIDSSEENLFDVKSELEEKMYSESNAKCLKLLDVGSCYNPFNEFPCLDVLAVDIAPASSDVKWCDFLEVNIINKKPDLSQHPIKELQDCSFHIVVFSLLLEYLPSPEQRLNCCLNAYKVLQHEGILLIITPDSKHVGSNAKIMLTWRFILSEIGFSRIKYEKLPYLHCMAFRKSININIAKRWAQLQDNEKFYKNMYIPQDLNNKEMKKL